MSAVAVGLDEGFPMPGPAMEPGFNTAPSESKKNKNRRRKPKAKRKSDDNTTESTEKTTENETPGSAKGPHEKSGRNRKYKPRPNTDSQSNEGHPNQREDIEYDSQGQHSQRNQHSDSGRGMRYSDLCHRRSPGGSPVRPEDQGGRRQQGSRRPGQGRGGGGHWNQGPSSPLMMPDHGQHWRQQQSMGSPHGAGMYPGAPVSPLGLLGPAPFFPGHSPQPGYSPGFNDPRYCDPRGQDPRAYDPRGQDPRAYDPRGQNPRAYDPRGQDPRAYDPRGRPQHQGNNGHTPNNRQKQRQNSNNSNVKKFEKHWTSEEVSHGLKRGELVQGALRINPKNYEDCYIPHPDGLSDVYISGMKDRNRALNSDIVAVKLYPREEWKVLVEMLEDGQLVKQLQSLSLSTGKSQPTDTDPEETTTGEASTATGAQAPTGTPKIDGAGLSTPGTSSDNKVTPVIGKPEEKPAQNAKKAGQKSRGQDTPRKRFTTLKEYASTPEIKRVTKKLFGENKQAEGKPAEGKDDEETDEIMKELMDAVPIKALVRTGQIVAIIEKKNSRAATGQIRLMPDRNNHTALFVPNDHRMPRMMVPMDNCPKDFHARPDDHSQVLFIARLTEWEEHSQYARGELARSLGEAGEIEPETEGILISYGVDYAEFSDEALKCLPQALPWRIPESEFSYRKDLRKECVFTIDPATARDLDDALHVKDIGDGTYEVGVHIADVSFFLDDETALDEVASERSTSVYLVQKVIPMLPRLLCEELCSLNPGTDRLTFSVIWTMTERGEILDEWFGRTVINSCVKMAYDHAQGFIEEPDREWTEDELPPITGGYPVRTLMDKVLHLQKIAQNLRKKRFDDGALRLDQVKLSFTLDKESGMPNGFYVYQQRDSNKLIEEFMLLANMAVSHKIYKKFPEQAVLRRHPPPQTKMMDDLVTTCRSLGVPMDISSSKKIHESIQALSGETLEDRARAQILTVLCSKPMQNAKYFCTGMLEDEYEYRHYALNVPLYTHFTSPIRRYPDVMVHRLLAAALGYRPVPTAPKGDVQRQTDNSNDKKTNSKRVQELSSELYFSVFIKECGPLEERGMVMGVLDKSFDVLILSLGVVKRVYCEKLPLRDFGFLKKQKKPQLRLIWAPTEKHPQTVEQDLTIFSIVECILTGDKEPLKWTAVVKHPNHSK